MELKLRLQIYIGCVLPKKNILLMSQIAFLAFYLMILFIRDRSIVITKLNRKKEKKKNTRLEL